MALAAFDLHGFVLIRDSVEADSSCMLSSIFKLVLGATQREGSVLVVTTKHSTSHYSTMLRRLNLNVTNLASESRFKVLNALHFGQVKEDCDTFAVDRKALMNAIAQDLKALGTGSPNEYSILVFDDILVRARKLADSVGGCFPDATLLGCTLQSLISVCETSPMDIGAEKTFIGLGTSAGARCTVMVAHADVSIYAGVTSALGTLASSLVTVKPLGTGTSAEVESQIQIFRRSCNPIASANGALGYSEQTVRRQ